MTNIIYIIGHIFAHASQPPMARFTSTVVLYSTCGLSFAIHKYKLCLSYVMWNTNLLTSLLFVSTSRSGLQHFIMLNSISLFWNWETGRLEWKGKRRSKHKKQGRGRNIRRGKWKEKNDRGTRKEAFRFVSQRQKQSRISPCLNQNHVQRL
jgi:hypothetical protein